METYSENILIKLNQKISTKSFNNNYDSQEYHLKKIWLKIFLVIENFKMNDRIQFKNKNLKEKLEFVLSNKDDFYLLWYIRRYLDNNFKINN